MCIIIIKYVINFVYFFGRPTKRTKKKKTNTEIWNKLQRHQQTYRPSNQPFNHASEKENEKWKSGNNSSNKKKDSHQQILVEVTITTATQNKRIWWRWHALHARTYTQKKTNWNAEVEMSDIKMMKVREDLQCEFRTQKKKKKWMPATFERHLNGIYASKKK